ncbi:hypothetical protein A9507_13535 [Methanobacterium sp. A39]|uniref:Uncharacterized protein n=1 Tax=Methanobacterium bryantii TaxID=2161 RepID=A0A2A2H4L8_METBR|nr:hypothetical protein A9507_13535 [Methanobacterium sp. A39]PAV04361.1 hypothetical protein ASJ80_05820 [Methanobacterium bryantii]
MDSNFSRLKRKRTPQKFCEFLGPRINRFFGLKHAVFGAFKIYDFGAQETMFPRVRKIHS